MSYVMRGGPKNASSVNQAVPEVSVVIPTRERAATLGHALRSVTHERSLALEIIVCDNASQDQTEAVVRANGDPRIRYLRPNRRLSMSANWEFALSHARGEWVTFIGDDDALIPGGLVHALQLAQKFAVPLVRCRPCDYLWPEVAGTRDGRLAIPVKSRAEVRSGRAWIEKVLAGAEPYTELPTIYTGGLVRRDLIEKSRGPDGLFFRSQIPDVYSAVRLASLEKHYAWSDRPFAVNGASRMSTGMAMIHKSSDTYKGTPLLLFLQEDNIPLHPKVPPTLAGDPPPCLLALVYECYLQVQDIDATLPARSPIQQLESIIRSAPSPSADLDRWVEAFAKANDIDTVPRVRRSWGHKYSTWSKRLRPDRIIITNNSAPIVVNVYDASRVAARYLEKPRPSAAKVYVNLGQFVVKSLIAGRALIRT
ncbi:MAG: glycosyltransferase family 2 protein [Sphingomonadaceae bacterium]